MCHLILEACGGVSFNTTQKSIEVTGTSNKFDGTEHDLTWDRGEFEDATRKEEKGTRVNILATA